MTAAAETLTSSSSSAINHGAASNFVEDSSLPGSELAEGSDELMRLGVGVGEAVELGESVELGEGVCVPEAVGLGVAAGVGVGLAAVTTGTPLQVEPQPVVFEDRVTEVRPTLVPNTSVPAVGAFPKKVADVRWLEKKA